jgi:hypothetical protein
VTSGCPVQRCDVSYRDVWNEKIAYVPDWELSPGCLWRIKNLGPA